MSDTTPEKQQALKQAEAALRDSELRFRAIWESEPWAYFKFDD